MKTIILQPHVWTDVGSGTAFQVTEPKAVRFNIYGTPQLVSGTLRNIAPDIDSDTYFVTQSYDLRPIFLAHYTATWSALSAWLMPDGDDPVKVVVSF